MISFIRQHESWFSFIIFGSTTAVLFVSTPISLIQELAQSVFFNFLGPAAGPAANLSLSTIGGAIAVVSIKGAANCLVYLHDKGQVRVIHPAHEPVTHTPTLFGSSTSSVEDPDLEPGMAAHP